MVRDTTSIGATFFVRIFSPKVKILVMVVNNTSLIGKTTQVGQILTGFLAAACTAVWWFGTEPWSSAQVNQSGLSDCGHLGFVSLLFDSHCSSTVKQVDFFSSFRGLRQGDPISLLLFILVMDILSILVKEAIEVNILEGFLCLTSRVDLCTVCRILSFLQTSGEQRWAA